MKRTISLALCILIAFAFSATIVGAQAKTKVSYWGLWGGYEQQAVQQVIDWYNAEHKDVEIEYIQVPDYGTKIAAAFASGDVPDAAFSWSWLVADLGIRGSLLPLDPYMSGDIAKDKFIPVLLKLGTVKGNLVAWPTFPWAWGLYFNKKLLKDAGIDPSKPPKTIAELDAMVEKLVVKGSDGRLERVGMMPFAIWDRLQWLYLFGGSLFDEKAGKLTMNAPRNVEAVTWLASYAKKWGITQLQTFQGGIGNFFSTTYPFWTGKTALDIHGNWMGKYIKNNVPTMDWGVAAPPVQPPVKYGTVYTTCDYNLVPKAGKHTKEGVDFLKYWYSTKASTYLTYQFYTFSPIVALNKDPAYLKDHPNPTIKFNADLATQDTAFTAPVIPVFQFMVSELDAAIDKVIYQKDTAENALAEAQKKVEAEYTKVMARYK